MGISDWISAIAAVIGIGLSVFVYYQGRKHDRKIDKRDERRHYNTMDQNMKQFYINIIQNYPIFHWAISLWYTIQIEYV